MASIDIGNITETVQFNDYTINVDLLDLASVYDAALIKFKYNQNADLSNDTATAEIFTSSLGNWVNLNNSNIDTVTAVRDETSTGLTENTDYEIDYIQGRIKILDTTNTGDGLAYEIDYTYGPKIFSQAMFTTGSTSQLIDGLTEGSTYYYKVVADTVAYNSQASMVNAVNEQGFMSDLANSEIAMTEVANSGTAMTEVANSEIAMTEVANSGTAIQLLFGSSDINRLYESAYNYLFLNSFWTTQVGDVSIATDYIYIYTNTDSESSVARTVDLSDKTTLYIDWEDISTGTDSTFSADFLINGAVVTSKTKASTRETSTIDVTSYGTEATIKVRVNYAGPNEAYDLGFAIYACYAE